MTEDSLTPISRTPFPSGRQMKWLLALLLAYFSVRLLFFAVAIASYVPPDEVTHLGLSQIFSKVLLLPDNTPETYQYGLVTNVAWLYYWVMGKLLLLNVFGLSDLFFLRLLNLPLAFATVYYTCRLLRLLTDDRLTQLLLVVVMTNTLMFSFLSAMVSPDNLANFFAVMAIYYLISFFKEKSRSLLALSLLFQLAGCLTKASFLPLALALALLLICQWLRRRGRLFSEVKSFFNKPDWRSLVLLIVFFSGLTLNIQLYGGNYAQFGQLKPDMSKVVTEENAMNNRLAARYIIFDKFKSGRISYGQAIRMTSAIRHEGDRAGTVYLLRNYLNRQYQGEELLGPFEYVFPWAQKMFVTVYGVMGHISIFSKYPANLPIIVLFVLAGVACLLRWRPGGGDGVPVLLAMICGIYSLLIMFAFNYKSYLYSESLPVAIQGRYIFPVISSFYALFSYYLMQLFRDERVRLGLACVAALVFIFLDFPFFLYHATEYWFAW